MGHAASMTDNRSPPPSVRKPDRGQSFSGVGSVRVARPKEEEGTHMHAEMDWAGSFVTMLPIPVCLIDKKGFVHQTNEEFNDLLKIPVENGLCPYAGRFFKCPSFRSSLELLVDSEIVLVIPLKIEWFSTVLVSQEANEHYEWSLSGCKKSSAAVLTGRLYMGVVAKSVRETVTGFNPNLPTEQQSEAATNVAKYQRSLARRRSLQTERPLESMINLNAQSKWERFEKRVFAANEESRANLTVEDRQGFVEIITVAATNHRKSQRAMLEPLNLVTEPSL